MDSPHVSMLRPNRASVARKALLGTLLCLCSTWVALDGPFPQVGQVCTLFFGYCTVVLMGALHPRSGLELTDERLIFRSPLRHFSYAWSDIECFGLLTFGPVRAACLRLSNRALGRTPLRLLNFFLTEYHDGLPNIFDLQPQVLVKLLNRRLSQSRRAERIINLTQEPEPPGGASST